MEKGEEAVGEEGPSTFADSSKSVPAEIITSNKDGVIDVKKIAVTIKVGGQLLSPPPKQKRSKRNSITPVEMMHVANKSPVEEILTQHKLEQLTLPLRP